MSVFESWLLILGMVFGLSMFAITVYAIIVITEQRRANRKPAKAVRSNYAISDGDWLGQSFIQRTTGEQATVVRVSANRIGYHVKGSAMYYEMSRKGFLEYYRPANSGV